VSGVEVLGSEGSSLLKRFCTKKAAGEQLGDIVEPIVHHLPTKLLFVIENLDMTDAAHEVEAVGQPKT
jgi:hypothetical protein